MSLEFHKEAFADLLEEDGLLIMAPGLGILKVAEKFVQLGSTSLLCTLVLNCSNSTAHELVEGLAAGSNSHLIRAETPSTLRTQLYLRISKHQLTIQRAGCSLSPRRSRLSMHCWAGYQPDWWSVSWYWVLSVYARAVPRP